MIVGNGIVHAKQETELDASKIRSVTAAYINPGSFEANLGAVTLTDCYISYANKITSNQEEHGEARVWLWVNYGDLNKKIIRRTRFILQMQYGFGYGFDGTGSISSGYVTSYNAPTCGAERPSVPLSHLDSIGWSSPNSTGGPTIFREELNNGIDRLINATAYKDPHQTSAQPTRGEGQGQ